MRGPIATYVGGLLMLYTLFSTDLQAAEFPPKNAVPISAPLYLDKRRMGMAQMLVMPDPQLSYVQATPLLAILNGLVQEERLKEMESATTQGFFALQDAAKVGIDLRFDEALVAVIITIPSENKKQQSLKARGVFDTSNKTITPPSPFSAYLNIFGSQDYVEAGLASKDLGRQPFRMSTDGALNMRGWAL